MTSLEQYAQNIWERQKKIAIKSGADITQATKTERVFNKSLVVIIAALMKTLVDQGVITDAQLIATLNLARDADYQDEPFQPPPPDPIP